VTLIGVDDVHDDGRTKRKIALLLYLCGLHLLTHLARNLPPSHGSFRDSSSGSVVCCCQSKSMMKTMMDS
jgi:hypothetical protein